MFIESLKVSYPQIGWSLVETKFDRFNLLVGASGVGKTRLLLAIRHIAGLATGELESQSIFGVFGELEWSIKFLGKNGDRWSWEGHVKEKEGDSASTATKDRLTYLRERLLINDTEVAFRDDSGLKYHGTTFPIPKLTSQINLLGLFFEQAEIAEAVWELTKIAYPTGYEISLPRFGNGTPIGMPMDIGAIRNLFANIGLKLYLAFKQGEQVFEEATSAFREVFPLIEPLEVKLHTYHEQAGEKHFYDVVFKEKGIQNPYSIWDLSSGMRRSFEFLVYLALCPDNSLILIDEFENSLGANCIDLVAEAVQGTKRGIQFIVTSHHPYIINSIGFKHWKIVTRKGGVVSTHPASEFGLGRSRHENFSQLVQLEAFQTGMMPE